MRGKICCNWITSGNYQCQPGCQWSVDSVISVILFVFAVTLVGNYPYPYLGVRSWTLWCQQSCSQEISELWFDLRNGHRFSAVVKIWDKHSSNTLNLMIISMEVMEYVLMKMCLAKHCDVTYTVLVIGKVLSSFVMWWKQHNVPITLQLHLCFLTVLSYMFPLQPYLILHLVHQFFSAILIRLSIGVNACILVSPMLGTHWNVFSCQEQVREVVPSVLEQIKLHFLLTCALSSWTFCYPMKCEITLYPLPHMGFLQSLSHSLAKNL